MNVSRLLLLGCLTACSLAPDLPPRPPLAGMEEPLDLLAEPDDEAARQLLPAGSFAGLVLDDARDTLAAKLDQEAQLRVAAVVDNSPADAAGLQPGDLLLEARVDGGAARVLRRPSEWRQLELDTAPGSTVELFVDRAGREARTELRLVARVRPAPRTAAERFREEDRVGIVLRTATETEARAANLGPGGGAVLVGLARSSPWRATGLRFGDLVTAVDGVPVAHPQDLLARIRRPDAESLRLDCRRNGATFAVDAPLSQRGSDLTEITLPILFSYEADRGRSEWSLLLGLVNYRSTAAAWRFRLLWLIGFGGGDADRLLEVGG
ncbi:MAG: PDZ domain-containing protein [Planctomycetes bacterium]|nr:PDZ domain-containing protein [Planctomycetota bacterium]